MGIFIKFECDKCGEYECDHSYEEKMGPRALEIRKMEHLYDWVFNYNPYRKEWRAVKRDNYHLMFSNGNYRDVLKSSDINTLFEIISKTNGDPIKIKELIKIK